MRNMRTAAIVIGALLLVPPSGLASTAASTTPVTEAAGRSSSKRAQMHATKGVVKSVDATTLVVSRSRQYGHEITFVLNPSTQQAGKVTVGSTVEVRYRTEGKQNIATVVSLERPKTSPLASISQ
jgi:hypothetical protein